MSTSLALLIAFVIIVAVYLAQSTKKRVVTIEEVWSQSLVISKSFSHCGNCGSGGYGVPLTIANDPTCCIHCGTTWVYGWLAYDEHRPTQASDDAQVAAIAKRLDVKLLGCGDGNLGGLTAGPDIWRRFGDAGLEIV